eukprot:jgi/Tetstr1/421936/TSEL_012835.t1
MPKQVTYLRRFKAKKALTKKEQVAERLIYSRVFDPAEHGRSAPPTSSMASSPPSKMTIKRLGVGLAAACKAHAAAHFKKIEREKDPDTAASRKIKDKMAREKQLGAWRHYPLGDGHLESAWCHTLPSHWGATTVAAVQLQIGQERPRRQ